MLTPADLALLVSLGITADFLDQRHVHRVDDREARRLLALNGKPGDLQGVVFPYIVPWQPDPVTYRIRRDHHEIERGKPKNKYLGAFGDQRHLYFATSDMAILRDIAVTILIVEAEKSVLAATCAAARVGRSILAVGIGGCWSWRGRKGKVDTPNGGRADEVGTLPDFNYITWTDRDVVLIFDSNTTRNHPTILAARRALTLELEQLGAHVRVVDLPNDADVNGPDDFLGKHGDAALFALIDEAVMVHGVVPLGRRDPQSGRLVLSTTRTLPTAAAYVQTFYDHPGGRRLHNYADVLLEWRDNRYGPIEDAAIKCQLQAWLHDALRPVVNRRTGEITFAPFDSNPTTVTHALDSLRAFAHLPATIESPSWLDAAPHPPAREILPCRSMNLHIPTGQVFPATPALFTLSALAFDHDPDAPPPALWLAFLAQLWPDDPVSIALLQQWFGYCLIADTSQQKILLVVGPRRSGKGTIARILTRLIGTANVVGPTTSSLASNFGLQPLIGKSLAIVSDARFTGENVSIVVERLLCISGEDTLSVDRKFLEAVSMRLATRFMFLTNELPRLNDASTALAGRFLILRLTESFYGEEDPTLTDRLSAELPGILLWAIDGWIRLQEGGHFVQSPKVADAIEDLEDLASPVRPFLREYCTILPDLQVPLDTLYTAWEMWSKQTGRKPSTRQMFGRDLASAVPGIKRRRSTEFSPFYAGLGLTAEAAVEVDRFQKARQRRSEGEHD